MSVLYLQCDIDTKTYEPMNDQVKKNNSTHSENSDQSRHQQSVQNVFSAFNWKISTNCWFMCTAKTLINLDESLGWSECLLCVKVSLLVLSPVQMYLDQSN